MNGRNSNLAWIAALAFAGVVSLLSCSSSDPTSPDIVGGGGGGIPGTSPSIAFVLPDETCANAGNTILIYGNNFPSNPLPTVTINGVTATVFGLSQATLQGVSYSVLSVETGFDPSTIPPSGLLVTVTVSSGSGTTSLPNALRMLPGCTRPPAVVAIDPSSAPRTGGSSLTISGIDLACVTSVSFSGTQTPGLVLNAPIVGVIDDQTIVVSAPVNPSATSETFDVAVSSDCGTGVLPGAFIFSGSAGNDLVPNATSIAPPEGPASGGNEVRITGTDLNLVTSIRIGSLTLGPTQFTYLATGQILISSMPPSPVGSATAVPLNVTVIAGSGPDNSPVVYTYLGEGAPECGPLAPTSGTQLGGTTVVITAALGSSLSSVDGVTFGGVPGTGIAHPTANQLVVTAPAYPTAIDVEVVLTIGGNPVATCPLIFSYTPSDPSAAFSVDSIFPSQGPQSGGTQIQIAGSGLTAVSSITICGVTATIQQTAQELVTAVTRRFDGTTPATCDVVVRAGALGATLPAAFTYTPVVPDGQFFTEGASTAPAAGGLNFRIRGSELIGVTQVSFSGSQGASGQALACEVQVQGNTEVSGIVPRYFTPGGPFPADVDVFVSSSGGIDSTTAVSLATGRRFRYYANPRLTAASGPGGSSLVEAGQFVTVNGTNFIPESDVFVGSLEISNSGILEGRSEGEERLSLPFDVIDNNTLTFFFPAVRVQDFYDIKIQTPLPELTCTEDYSFTLLRSIFFGTPPSAASVDPPSGTFAGGTQVTISGDFDTEVTRVTINGVGQTILEQTATTVTIVTQPVLESTAGTPRDVVLSGLGGASNTLLGAYTFIPQPSVFSAATTTVNCPGLVSPPNVLPVTQGQLITVTGDDLVGVNSATVGGVLATVFPISDSIVEVAIPPAPGAGGPIFDVVLSATFQPGAGGATAPPLSGILLAAVRYQDPPTVTSIAPASADPGSFITITGTSLRNADGTPTIVDFGGTVVAAANVSPSPDGKQLLVRVPPGPEGQSVQVQVQTCQGSAFSPVAFKYPCNPPIVNSLLPAAGAGGTVVTLSGSSLISADGTVTSVTFGEEAALINYLISTPTSLVVTAPPGEAGVRAAVRLTTCGGTEILAGFFTYGCGNPQITGLTPSQGRSGTVVVISGSNLDSPDGTPVTVLFGVNPAIVDSAASSSTELIVTAPVGVGAVTVTVTNCGSSTVFSTPPFTYCNTPTANIAVSTGATGDVVVITGTSLINPNTSRPRVTFGGVEAVVLESPIPTNSSISVRVPANSGNQVVEVETCGGRVTAGSFQYCLRPNVTGFTPSAAPGGALVTLLGTDLLGADGSLAIITFGGVAATVVDDSPFVVRVPAGPTGTVVVLATTCGGTSTALFTYCDLPTITDVNVGGGLPEGPAGTAVSIVGTSFIGGNGANPTVLFGTQTATLIDASATNILVTAPGGIATGTTVSVRVSTCGGTATTGVGDNYTYRTLPACPTPPSATTITLPVGATGPAGTQVTLRGTAIVGQDGNPGTVLFGAFTAMRVTFAEDVPAAGTDTIVVIAPDGGFPDMTNVPVTIQTCGGPFSVPGGFTYLAAGDCPGPAMPTIATLTPATGGPGTQVTLTGTNLVGPDGNPSLVRFGAFTATRVTFAENVPAAGTDTIVVTAPDGGFADGTMVNVTAQNCAATSAASIYTYQGANNCPGPAVPVITTLTPANGGSGTQVTLVGPNLVGPNGQVGTVRFGAFTAGLVTFAEDVPAAGSDTLVVTAPNGGFPDGTLVSVRVQTCIGLSAAMAFTYQGMNNCPGGAVPAALVLSPASGGTGAQVTVTGTNLFGPDGLPGVVRFGAFTATQVTAVEDLPAAGTDTIVVTAPAGFANGATPSVTVENCVGLSAGVVFTYTGAIACPGGAVPAALVLSPASGGIGAQVTITGTSLFGPDGNVGVVRFGAFTATQISAVEDLPAAGTDTIVVTAPAGFSAGATPSVTVENCVGLSAGVVFTYTADCVAPTFVAAGMPGAVDPNGGPAGTLVTLAGTNFQGANGADPVVQFGTRVATLVNVTATSAVVQAPVGIPNGVPVSVRITTCGGTATAPETFTFSDVASCVGAAPSVASLSTASGAAGDPVRITGSDLIGPDGNVSDVRFGTFTATVIDFFDDPLMLADTILVVVPGGPPVGSTVTVSVENCAGIDQSSSFMYETPAVCTINITPAAVMPVNPNTGSAQEIVTITGTGLIGDDNALSSVFFGVQAATVLDQTSTQILVRAPAGVPGGTAVNVTVAHCGDTAVVGQFTYDSIFDAVAVAPNSGPRTGGQTVFITGTGLAGTSSVTICGVAASVVGMPTNTQVRVTTGAYFGPAPAVCDVFVTDGVDSDTLGMAYTYTPLLPNGVDLDDEVDSGMPAETAPASGGTTFRIRGTDLLDVDDVTFGGLVNDPKACELQAQNDSMGPDDLVTGVVPAYRTGGGPFPANVQIFVESDAGRDNTPVVRDAGFPALFTYYANPTIVSAFSDGAPNDGAPDADCGSGCGRPGRQVRVNGFALSPEFWSHVGRVMLTETGGGSGLSGDVPFSITSTGDGGGANTLTFILPGSAEPNDVFDITIFTPNNDSTCTGTYSQVLFGAVKVSEFVCIDSIDNDADGDTDCADSDCIGQVGPGGVICQAAETNCSNGLDDDGDGLSDCLDDDCDGLNGGGFLCESGTEANCSDGADNDGDGPFDCADSDCDMMPCAPGMTCVAGACT